MTIVQALAAFIGVVALLTLTPGLDTAMVLRASTLDGRRPAALAALGIAAGCLVWGLAVALGLAVVLTASRGAYMALKWVGAAYLVWLGVRLVAKPRTRFDLEAGPRSAPGGGNWWLRGLLSNVLNPKVGVFYVSFLPQFVPTGVLPAPFVMLLAAIHALLGLGWFAALVAASAPLSRWLRRGAARWCAGSTASPVEYSWASA